MTGETPPITPAPDLLHAPSFDPTPRRRSRLPLVVALIAFIAGVAAVLAALPLVERWRSPHAAASAAQVASAPAAAIDPQVPITLDGLAAREAALSAQLDALTQRLAIADAGSRTAAGFASRAERLLVVTAARRELNRGLPLGYLETQLHQLFDADNAAAVGVVVAAARAPATLEDLRQALDRLGPMLKSGSLREGVWSAVRRSLSGLIVIRRDTMPSPQPEDRLERTRRMLDAGNVEGAMAEVARMPGAADAASWTAAARRYVEARQALARLERSALRTSTPQSAPPQGF